MVPAYPANAKFDKNNQNKQTFTGTVIQCMEMIIQILHLHSISVSVGIKIDSKILELD